MYNSLSQTLIKLTCPGVPDIYQGTELWDFSLVDPDNRRPVDYGRRQEILSEFAEEADPLERADSLTRTMQDGRIKLFLTYVALNARKRNAEVFQRGSYTPLGAEGLKALHLVAFARIYQSRTFVIATPRLTAGLLQREYESVCNPKVWQDTRIELPSSGTYRNAFTGEVVVAEEAENSYRIPAAKLFMNFPAALLLLEKT